MMVMSTDTGGINMYVHRKYPDFSWSNSRHKTFLECKRKYYHHYYESHNGWSFDASEEKRTAYRLKNISNLPIVLGEEIHKAIDKQLKNFLNGKKLLTEDEMIQLVSQGLNKAYIDSTKFLPSWLERPKKYKMLHEIYYEQSIRPEDIEATKDKLRKCIHHFFQSQTYQDILTKLEVQVLQSEEFRIFEVNGVDVFVVLDFVYKDVNQEKWVVIDWKSGKESADDRSQLAFYALYLSKEHKIPVEDIVVRNEYLLPGTSREHKLTQFDLDSSQEIMHNSIFLMQNYLEDLVQNRPLGKEQFEMNTSRKCNSCNFKELCFPASGQ